MESYFLSETLKYLYMLFDVGTGGMSDRLLSENILTTEAHFLPFDWRRHAVGEGRALVPKQNEMCSIYGKAQCPLISHPLEHPMNQGVRRSFVR